MNFYFFELLIKELSMVCTPLIKETLHKIKIITLITIITWVNNGLTLTTIPQPIILPRNNRNKCNNPGHFESKSLSFLSITSSVLSIPPVHTLTVFNFTSCPRYAHDLSLIACWIGLPSSSNIEFCLR